MTLELMGAACLAIAIVSGGLKINEVELPRLPRHWHVALVVAGVMFIGLGVSSPEVTVQAESLGRGTVVY
ncbi:hypothetical protein ABT063_31400 [Streptomyces sp. NPDC002838]|uniref:hypothetical protein n=1 Tax=Streptomyces sp. NPDC002838 TaxID=3154436 RepID=UPI003316B890